MLVKISEKGRSPVEPDIDKKDKKVLQSSAAKKWFIFPKRNRAGKISISVSIDFRTATKMITSISLVTNKLDYKH